MSHPEPHHVDWLIIGSGFGGSVSALRLAEKGYSVRVLECGRRYNDEDFAKTGWNLRKFYWAPRLGLRGILRLSLFRDVFVASGSGVGGGSLTYANTLYRPRNDAFFQDPQWGTLDDWKTELDPHYEIAEKMLGVTTYNRDGAAEDLMRALADAFAVPETFQPTQVGVFLGEEAVTVADPYFGGKGPDRTGCIHCGACMIGCRYGAKNTLVKNYLWLAERLGVQVTPERQVVDIRPLAAAPGAANRAAEAAADVGVVGAANGKHGFQVTSERSGAWLRKRRQVICARNVVVSAGPLGTNELLQRCKASGSLPRLSSRLGELVRTNSEAILGVTTRRKDIDFSQSVAISSSIWTDDHTHIEPVTYGVGGDSMNLLSTLLTGNGTKLTRPFKLLGQIVRHPLKFLRISWPFGWSRRSILLLVMQSHDNAIKLVPRKTLFTRRLKLTTQQDPNNPNPTFIPVANQAAELGAKILDGIAQSSITEALFNVPTTAHILGGAPIGASPESGVVDAQHRVFGYTNLMICDGSVIPANIGVNPSLTITAMTELAMSRIPAKDA